MVDGVHLWSIKIVQPQVLFAPEASKFMLHFTEGCYKRIASKDVANAAVLASHAHSGMSLSKVLHAART